MPTDSAKRLKELSGYKGFLKRQEAIRNRMNDEHNRPKHKATRKINPTVSKTYAKYGVEHKKREIAK